MEHKIFRYIRHHIKIPFFIRFILACFLIFISLIPIILPLFPGSIFLGVFLLVIGILLIIPGHKIKHVIKIRKGLVFLSKNLHKKNVVEHKMRDIKSHIIEILNDRKEKKELIKEEFNNKNNVKYIDSRR